LAYERDVKIEEQEIFLSTLKFIPFLIALTGSGGLRSISGEVLNHSDPVSMNLLHKDKI
jgi:hypothetical protein